MTVYGAEDVRSAAQINRDYFDEKVRRHGRSLSALGWRTADSQHRRFSRFISGMTTLSSPAILDVGCGQGDFFSALRESGRPFSYLGIDVSSEMVAVARALYPDAHFEVGDAGDLSSLRDLLGAADFKPDVMVASGVLNLRVPQQMTMLQSTLKVWYEVTQSQVMFNLLSNRAAVSERDGSDLFYYYDPPTVLAMAMQMTTSLRLDHCDFGHDFSVIMTK